MTSRHSLTSTRKLQVLSRRYLQYNIYESSAAIQTDKAMLDYATYSSSYASKSNNASIQQAITRYEAALKLTQKPAQHQSRHT